MDIEFGKLKREEKGGVSRQATGLDPFFFAGLGPLSSAAYFFASFGSPKG